MSQAIEHAHRWQIPTPAGQAAVIGTCAGCGAEREFATGYHGDDSWRRINEARPSDLYIERARAGQRVQK